MRGAGAGRQSARGDGESLKANPTPPRSSPGFDPPAAQACCSAAARHAAAPAGARCVVRCGCRRGGAGWARAARANSSCCWQPLHCCPKASDTHTHPHAHSSCWLGCSCSAARACGGSSGAAIARRGWRTHLTVSSLAWACLLCVCEMLFYAGFFLGARPVAGGRGIAYLRYWPPRGCGHGCGPWHDFSKCP